MTSPDSSSVASVVALLALALALTAVACHRERHSREVVYAPAPAPAPPPPPPCDPLGTWRVGGPTGITEIEVGKGDNPDTFVVKQKGSASAAGVGSFSSSQFKVNMGAATGGIYACKMADDCNSMTCGFNGGANPTVITKSSTSM